MALIGISVSGCILSKAAQVEAPSKLPPELSIEEHLLEEGRALEPLTFVPVEGTQEEILSKNRTKQARSPRVPCRAECTAILGDEHLVASLTVTTTQSGGQNVSVDVVRGRETVYSAELGDACVVPPLWGPWTYGDHWVLEAAHVEARREGGAVHCLPVGDIVRDGESLNEHYGYQETFGFQLINGEPFYFFRRDGMIGVRYNGQEIPLGYTRISHYQCCSGTAANLRSSRSIVAFFAERGGARYYVEIGVFE